jgi:hypothetical protein
MTTLVIRGIEFEYAEYWSLPPGGKDVRKRYLFLHSKNEGMLNMAFVRWRGQYAQLVATVYDAGWYRKITLAGLHDFYASDLTKLRVAEKFPHIKVDWEAVDRALAQGPPGILKKNILPEHLDMAAVEHHLRKWADDAEAAKLTGDATDLRIAAGVLTRWRAESYWENHPSTVEKSNVKK